MKLKLTNLNWLWLSMLIIVSDQLTKWLALKYLVPYQPKVITSFFNITLMFNQGAAFSFLNSRPGVATFLFSFLALIVSIVIIVWLMRLTKQEKIKAICLSLILGGAVGNLIDRLYHGKVTDFISLHINNYYWPTFNIADCAIVLGAILLIFSLKTSK